MTKLNGLKTNKMGNINQIPKPQVGSSNLPSPTIQLYLPTKKVVVSREPRLGNRLSAKLTTIRAI